MNLRVFGVFGPLPLLLLALPFTAPSESAAQAALSLAAAERAAGAAQAEAEANNWKVTIVITDADGVPVLVRRLDGASARSFDFAMGKAQTVIAAGMSTADYVAGVAAGTVTAIPDATAIPGGVPIRIGDTIVGAIAASGVRPDQDLQVADAGAAAFQP